MFDFKTKGGARFAYTVDFSTDAFANISFFNAGYGSILFHLSLRAEAGIAVFNRRLGEDWQDETPVAVHYAPGENQIEIDFAASRTTVRLNGAVVFDLDATLCPETDEIAAVSFRGALLAASIRLTGALYAPLPQPEAPLISVIVAVYNVESHIAACLRSLQQQDLTDFEVLVIDDGATDASRVIAQTAVAGDARFQILSFANGGLSEARNRGLDRARGQFIAFVDGDDRVEPNYLSRLHSALVADGGDWVACGLRFINADGSTVTHPAMHGAPPARAAEIDPNLAENYHFDSWTEVIRHYPSAWNKLYRRSLIEGLRFDSGTYYEDHAFFWQAACRTDHLLRLPDPLYLQTQGRAGQITRDGSDRVFEQFAVLTRLRGILDSLPARPDGDLAFARIASRLCFERALAITDPARRARFAATARQFFAQNRIDWRPDWDPAINRGFGLTLAGKLPISVIIPTDGATEPLSASLASLARQSLRDFETLLVCNSPDPVVQAGVHQAAMALPNASVLIAQPLPLPETDLQIDRLADAAHCTARARNRGLEAAQGEFLLFLDAGDTLAPHALSQGVDAMLRHGGQSGADLGFAVFRQGPHAPTAHSGLHDMTGLEPLPPGAFPSASISRAEAALRLHAHPSAKIFRRGFLHQHGLRFAPHLLQSWQMLLQASLLADAVVHLPDLGLTLDMAPHSRRFWQSAPPAQDLAAALDQVIAATTAAARDQKLPEGWQQRLLARALWEKRHFASFADATEAETFTTALIAEAGIAPHRQSVSNTMLDPYIDQDTRTILSGDTAKPAKEGL